MPRHLDLVRGQPCMACGVRGCHAHHAVGGSMIEKVGLRGRKKSSDYLAISLCPTCHQGPWGVHAGVEAFERRYGSQVEMLEKLGNRMGLDLFALAEQEALDNRSSRRAKPIKKRSKPYQPPRKQIPRGDAR